MKDLQGENEMEIQPTIQVKHLPMLLRPKQTCELFGIDLKALHKLETSGRVKAVRIGPMKVQRRYSPVAVAKALGVDLMAENYTLVAGMDFTRELGGKLANSSDAVLAKTRQLMKDELQGLRQSVGEIVRSEINNALQNTVVKRRPESRPQEHLLRGYVPPQKQAGY
jgi:predicted site-specific integrase-resolvase